MAAPRLTAVALVALLLVPLAGCLAPVEGGLIEGSQGQVLPEGQTLALPAFASGHATDEELRSLLESLQPRIGVYGVGGAGCNAANRLFDEGLFENTYVTGYAINTDAQALLMSSLEQKVLIGRTARGRGAGGDPTKGEAAALESEMARLSWIYINTIIFLCCNKLGSCKNWGNRSADTSFNTIGWMAVFR